LRRPIAGEPAKSTRKPGTIAADGGRLKGARAAGAPQSAERACANEAQAEEVPIDMERMRIRRPGAATLVLGWVALAWMAPPAAAAAEEIFEAGDHCVAYRTVKDIFFGFDAEIVGRSCEVSASVAVEPDGAGSRVVVAVPVKSLDSGNPLRDWKVADLLGAKLEPELRFVSDPLDATALRADVADGRFVLPGTLQFAGRQYAIDFPLELIEAGERRDIAGHLATTFAAFDVEVPTVAGGLVARPHEELELVVRLDLERVQGLAEWAAAAAAEQP